MNITKIYSDNNGEIIASSNDKDYFLKKDNEHFKIDKSILEEAKKIYGLKYKYSFKDTCFFVIVELIIILLSLVVYFSKNNYVVIDSNIVIATFVLIANIIIHEFGHIIFLKLFYKEYNPKMGFKMIFIYPAFYVDTSDSYLIPKYKKLAVNLAGNAMNSLYVLLIACFFPKFSQYNYLVVTTILINFIPIIKSDGYYFFIGLFNKVNKEKSKKAEFIEDFIRGLCMFVFLYLIDKTL